MATLELTNDSFFCGERSYECDKTGFRIHCCSSSLGAHVDADTGENFSESLPPQIHSGLGKLPKA